MLVSAEERRGTPRHVAQGQLLRDFTPPPVLSPQLPILARYVNNGNFVCWNQVLARDCLRAVIEELNERGYSFRVED